MFPDLDVVVWRKSSRSGGNNGDCVELACDLAARAVRDSKNVDGGVLEFGASSATGFLNAVKASRFDG